MSDNKRSRKYSNLKENKQRTILFAKKDEPDPEPPKILLKPKEKPTTPASPAISIATRDTSAALAAQAAAAAITTSVASFNALSLSAPTSSVNNVAIAKPLPTAIKPTTASDQASPIGADQQQALPPPSSQPPQQSSAEKSAKMHGPVTLINDHYQLEPAALALLQDASAQYFVVGAIGTQSSGKSTLLNMLPSTEELSKTMLHEHFIQHHSGVFNSKRTGVHHGSCAPLTEGVQMYVTADRLILLDCAPVLCNPYKKDAAQAELDDLRLVIFMLSVCQTVLVVDIGSANLQLLRLLQTAELMKPSLDLQQAATGGGNGAVGGNGTGKIPEQLLVERSHFPNVMFVHNLAEHWQCRDEQAERTRRLYMVCFRQSRLHMFDGNVPAMEAIAQESQTAAAAALAADAAPPADDSATNRPAVKKSPKPTLNMFTFPRFRKFTGHQLEMTTIVKHFRHWVLMAPRTQFAGTGSGGGGVGGAVQFGEKCWSQLVQTVWDSHKSNYFLRKYEADLATRYGV